ncbi:hypothetical protein CIW48_19200 [Methylobacterium sp. P1-11]|uniref:hypothetical protein n=1 Tax=Methylobacterium sp. P1-11 TaxID=2024616 RepID=UPI0011F07B5A|nr:hypothetical protein [Methylobacterium sp. P1-11]KAA0122131.1 hypothetical protein CIW48_19200 [Methylobacterium sp. P1-11]
MNFIEYDPVVEAVELLRVCRHSVEPDGDFEQWRIDGGEWVSLEHLLGLALRLGLTDGPSRLQ